MLNRYQLFSQQEVVPLSVYYTDGVYHILLKKNNGHKVEFVELLSDDGLNFPTEKALKLDPKLFSILPASKIDFLTFAADEKKYFASHYYSHHHRFSVFADRRKIIAGTDLITGPASLLKLQDQQEIAIISDTFFRIVRIGEQEVRADTNLLFTSRHDHFDNERLQILTAWEREHDIVILYDATKYGLTDTLLQVGAARISKTTHQVLWRSEQAIFEQRIEEKRVRAFGAVCESVESSKVLIYFDIAGNIFSLPINNPFLENGFVKKTLLSKVLHPISLIRHKQNPVLSPKTENVWEAEGVFNPAVFFDGKEVHALYRAVGSDGVSRIGYASSEDGLTFDKRLPEPIFSIAVPEKNPEINHKAEKFEEKFSRELYGSGGSWVGCEDPRVVKIDDKVYMTYTAFGGWNLMRIALTSIKVKDLQQGKWNWAEPTYISPANRRDKNWVIFPEKINGKIAILHSIAPKVQIDYVDNLDTPFTIEAKRPEGTQTGRRDYWDNKMRGAGAPPIKTRLGWLLLYHATDMYDSNCYKLGAMILDSQDPTKILYRSDAPILEPKAFYENDGKPGVVYATGAIVKDGKLFVYYGGGDKHTCVAGIELEKLLQGLSKQEPVKMQIEK